MQMSASAGQAVGYMYDYLMHDMCVIIKKEILEKEHNFILEDIRPKGYALAYDSYHTRTPISDFDIKNIFRINDRPAISNRGCSNNQFDADHAGVCAVYFKHLEHGYCGE